MLPACVDVEESERFEPAEEEAPDIKGRGNNGVVTREEVCFVARGPRVSVDVWAGVRVKTRVPRTSLNGSKQTSEEVTANNDDAFDQTGSVSPPPPPCFDLAGPLLIPTQTGGEVALKLKSHFKINVILHLQQNKSFFFCCWSKRFL